MDKYITHSQRPNRKNWCCRVLVTDEKASDKDIWDHDTQTAASPGTSRVPWLFGHFPRGPTTLPFVGSIQFYTEQEQNKGTIEHEKLGINELKWSTQPSIRLILHLC